MQVVGKQKRDCGSGGGEGQPAEKRPRSGAHLLVHESLLEPSAHAVPVRHCFWFGLKCALEITIRSIFSFVIYRLNRKLKFL